MGFCSSVKTEILNIGSTCDCYYYQIEDSCAMLNLPMGKNIWRYFHIVQFSLFSKFIDLKHNLTVSLLNNIIPFNSVNI